MSRLPENSGSSCPLLMAHALHKSFVSGLKKVEVLRGVNLTIEKGEMIAIVGASGSGKTTLLQILGTLDVPDSGRLLFKGDDVSTLNEAQISRHRNRHVGFIFQFHHLLPEFTALENIMMPGLIQGQNTNTLKERAAGLLDRINLADRGHHRSGELSGGEQQRVALARALIMKPDLLLADEPTGNLDSASGQNVFELLREMSRSLSLAVIMVTHNLELAGAMDHRLTLKDGLIHQ